jgi:phosphoglycolate phosphatase
MERSFEKTYGLKDGFRGIQLMGRTDPSLLLEALEQHHLEWKDAEVEKFREYYYWFLEEEIEKPRPDKTLCPGVPSLLTALYRERDVVLGLLTGNWRYSGLIKLRHFGIDGFFTLGAFADDSIRREDLVPFALDRAAKASGIKPDKETVFVIGDTPLDIRCARPHGVRTVAVATGVHSLEALRSENPDYLFENFSDTDEVLRIFRG